MNSMNSPERRTPRVSAFERSIIRAAVSTVDAAVWTMYSIAQRSAVYDTGISTLAQAAVDERAKLYNLQAVPTTGQVAPAAATHQAHPYDYLATTATTASTQEVQAKNPLLSTLNQAKVYDLESARAKRDSQPATQADRIREALLQVEAAYQPPEQGPSHVEEAA